jgi:hypothetical protein
VNVLGLGALIAVGFVSAWYGGEGKRKPPPLPAGANMAKVS